MIGPFEMFSFENHRYNFFSSPDSPFLSLYIEKNGVTRVTRLQLGSSPVLARLCAVTPLRARKANRGYTLRKRNEVTSLKPLSGVGCSRFLEAVTCNPMRLQIFAAARVREAHG